MKACCAALVFVLLAASPVLADQKPPERLHSITDRSVSWPTAEDWQRLFLLRDYNTRVVVIGTTLLGLAAGTIGSFTLLRKRALMGDALSHATLPGIGLAFVIVTLAGGDGKRLGVLLTGAAISGIVGMACILAIRSWTRIKEDAALGIVLSVFFGAGVAILRVTQDIPEGNVAGLESFIYGKTASMIASDAMLIGAAAVLVTVMCGLFFKEFKLLCFDQAFARSLGYPILLLDGLLMGLVVIVTVIGLQAVGLVLIIALLIVPAAAARFWTERLLPMTVGAAAIGAVSSMIGSGMSALFPKLPSGAMIVLVAALLFGVSMLFGPARGVLMRAWRRYELNRKVDRQHLLRAMYEQLEVDDDVPNTDEGLMSHTVSFQTLLELRSWSHIRLQREINRAFNDGLLIPQANGKIRLTVAGLNEARRIVREHRLWEMYLITYADVAPSHVDRDADMIEHVLAPSMIAQLEALVDADERDRAPLHSPHAIAQQYGEVARGAGQGG